MAMKQGELVPQIVAFEGVRGYVDANNVVQLNAEDIARELGFTQTAKSGNEVVRWERVNRYLCEFGFIPTCGDDVKAGDYIPEHVFYLLAMKASNEAAKNFQLKIATEILPSIRKYGFYATPEKAEEIVRNPEAFIEHLITAYQRVKTERDELKLQLADAKPKADYCEKILQSPEALNVTVIAKDYGMSGVMFNQLLHSKQIQYPQGTTKKIWLLYQDYVGKGYTVTESVLTKNGGSVTHTRWTQRGRMFLYHELKKYGILPLCEREAVMATLIEEVDIGKKNIA